MGVAASIYLNNYKKTKPKEKKDFQFNFGKLSVSKTFSDKQKEIFYRELGMLLKSGVDFKKALEILSLQVEKKKEKELILELKDKIVHGKSIYESMLESKQFSPYEYYSVQIGEETRKLEEVLAELQKYFNRKIQMRRQIVSVLTYPSIVMLVTVLVLYFMLNKVLPMFSSVFIAVWLTKIVCHFSFASLPAAKNQLTRQCVVFGARGESFYWSVQLSSSHFVAVSSCDESPFPDRVCLER